MTTSHPHRILAAVAAAVLAVLGTAVAVLGQPADDRSEGGPAGTALLRIANWSPDTPAVDVRLSAFDGEGERQVDALRAGDTSAYQRVPAGLYTATVRAAADRGQDAWVVDSAVEVAPGGNFTFALVGPRAQRQSQLLEDELVPPDGDQASVRLVNSSVRGRVALRAGPGQPVAAEIGPRASSEYAPTASGRRTLALGRGGDVVARRDIALPPGSVNTIVAIDRPGPAGPSLVRVIDSLAPRPSAPTGPAATGGPAPATTTAADEPAAPAPTTTVASPPTTGPTPAPASAPPAPEPRSGTGDRGGDRGDRGGGRHHGGGHHDDTPDGGHGDDGDHRGSPGGRHDGGGHHDGRPDDGGHHGGGDDDDRGHRGGHGGSPHRGGPH